MGKIKTGIQGVGWTFDKIKKLWSSLKSNKEVIKKTEKTIKTLNKQKTKDIKHHGFSNAGKKIDNAKNRIKKLKLADQKRIKNMKKAGLAVGGLTVATIASNKWIDSIREDLDKYKPYKIKKGDTLSEIARDHGTTLKELKKANPGIKDLNKISIGQEIMLSPKVKDRKSVYQDMTKSEMASITKDKVVERKYGGQIGTPRGVGAALRGYGKGYK
jgi:LysM repeat protein